MNEQDRPVTWRQLRKMDEASDRSADRFALWMCVIVAALSALGVIQL